jgi:hypothetical protein
VKIIRAEIIRRVDARSTHRLDIGTWDGSLATNLDQASQGHTGRQGGAGFVCVSRLCLSYRGR